MSPLITTSISSLFLHLSSSSCSCWWCSSHFCFPFLLLLSSYIAPLQLRKECNVAAKNWAIYQSFIPHNPLCLQCNPCYFSLGLSLLPHKPLFPFCLWVWANVIPVVNWSRNTGREEEERLSETRTGVTRQWNVTVIMTRTRGEARGKVGDPCSSKRISPNRQCSINNDHVLGSLSN